MTRQKPDEPEEPVEKSDPLCELAEELSKPVSETYEEDQSLRLSPDAAARVRRTMAKVQASLNPRIGFRLPDALSERSLLGNYEGIAKLGRFDLPEGAMKDFAALARLPEEKSQFGQLSRPQSAFHGELGKRIPSSTFANLVPALSAEQSWTKQLKLINSDAYEFLGSGQSNLTALNAVLARNADLGFGGAAAKLASQFAVQQASWLRTIGPLLEKLKTGFYPANLEHIQNLLFEEVEAVVMLDGIALYGVPRKEVAEKLIRAKTTQARRAILGRRWKAISADCRAALKECTSASLANYISFAVAALDALDAEHTEAAQALAASLLDTLVNGYFGPDRHKYTPDMRGKRTTEEYDNFTVREFVAFAPLWQAYQKFKTEDGDPIPNTFSRHASVHGVSTRQFSRRNAVQALLFVTGLLVFLDEEASALEAA